jgi:hypothetical protein
MKLSARNQFKGTIVELVKGATSWRPLSFQGLVQSCSLLIATQGE